VKGKIKEEIGKATNNHELEVSGNAEEKGGTIQKWVGRLEKLSANRERIGIRPPEAQEDICHKR
jgi:uncharacterized protein YjbJ (UPF0337 family)